uniref:RNA helicase n=1 Tax=Globodera pallida TaxID=36090 RepID=A0A183BP15_GLOPA
MERNGGRTYQQRRGGGGRPSFFLRPVDDERASMIVEGDRLNLEGADEAAGSASIVCHNPYLAMSVQQQRQRLPIAKCRNHLLYLCEHFQTIIVVGETGSGKSTQLPQYLAEFGWAEGGQQICITQPRRVAAISLASRVADEMMCRLGDAVGYAVRFDECISAQSRIKFLTDGILLRELMSDPLLQAYSVVIVDEAHERSVNTDLIIGLLRKIVAIRDDLRVIISSATIEAEIFRDFFELNDNPQQKPDKNTATIISVEGRMFPVATFYTKVGVPDYVQTTVETVLRLHDVEPSGDILAFLTGQDEVERACDFLRKAAKMLSKDKDKLLVVPLYGGLPAREQFRAFDSAPYQSRKAIITTNIAETSVTIAGVCYVIDCGFVKMRVFSPKLGMETLMIAACSKSSAEQRAGRAGRVRPGKCFRLYPESEFRRLPRATLPEIQRCDLSSVVLRMKALGVQNVLKFHYLSRPSSVAMVQALQLLFALKAIDEDGLLVNPLGLHMAELPLAPMHAKALIASVELECSSEVATIIAMMQIRDVFVQPTGAKHKAELSRRSFSVEEGDHLTLLNVYSSFVEHDRSLAWCQQNFLNYKALCRAESIRAQFVGFLKNGDKLRVISCKDTIGDTAKIRRALLSGFFSQIAYYDHTGLYVTVKGEHSFKAYKGSVLMYRKEYPKWVLFTDVMQNSIRDLSEIDPAWLEHIAPHYYEFGSNLPEGKRRKMTEERSHHCSICKMPCHAICQGYAAQVVCFNCKNGGPEIAAKYPPASNQQSVATGDGEKYEAKPQQLHFDDDGILADRKRHRNNDATKKLEAIEWARRNSIKSAAKKFGVDRKSIQRWIKQEDKLKQQLNSCGGKRKRLGGGGRPVLHPDIDATLADWIKEMRQNKRPVSRSIIKNKATALFVHTDIKVSNGWLEKLLKRHNFVLRRTTTADQNPPPAAENDLELGGVGEDDELFFQI